PVSCTCRSGPSRPTSTTSCPSWVFAPAPSWPRGRIRKVCCREIRSAYVILPMPRPGWPSIVAAMSTAQTSTSQCQVLIVGAGPTGLVLAAQLLARGVQTRIIDKGEGPARQSRAVSIYARTLELLDTMELAESFIAHGHQVRRLHWYA